jgi:hypothetical protein
VNLIERKEAARARMQAARGELDYRGRQSFYLIVDLSKNPGREHTLKQHFKRGTCARELVGILETLAAKREDRFVFAGMEYLRKQCFMGDKSKGKNFSERAFWNAVRLVRELGILSPLLRRDGREGMIVAPHAALCLDEHKQCRFIGPSFVNRRKLGLVGRFSMCGNGDWIWYEGEAGDWTKA